MHPFDIPLLVVSNTSSHHENHSKKHFYLTRHAFLMWTKQRTVGFKSMVDFLNFHWNYASCLIMCHSNSWLSSKNH